MHLEPKSDRCLSLGDVLAYAWDTLTWWQLHSRVLARLGLRLDCTEAVAATQPNFDDV